MIFRALQADVSFGELFPSANNLVDEQCLDKWLDLLCRGHCSLSRDLHPLSFQLHAGFCIIPKWELSKLGCSWAVNLSLLKQLAPFFCERAQFQWSMAASLWSNGIIVAQEHSPPAIDSRAQTSFSSFNICITVLPVQPALINGNNTQIIAAANSWTLFSWALNSGVREPPVGCKHNPVLPNNP